jgi:DNA invertase Pin-like site-specific DNA recombinase
VKTRVVGCVRVSSQRQADEGVSLDAQREKLTAYAHAMDLELVEVVSDAGLSARSMDRPGLQRALSLLDDGHADGLLVVKLDRLTRSVRDLGELVDRYFAKRCSLLSVADSVDTRTAGGRLVLHVLASVSQWEREAAGERTREALDHLRTEGVRLGGEALGWRRGDRTNDEGRRAVEEIPEERETALLVRALRDEGHSLRAICAKLTEMNRKTKRGGAWRSKIVASVLRRSEAR